MPSVRLILSLTFSIYASRTYLTVYLLSSTLIQHLGYKYIVQIYGILFYYMYSSKAVTTFFQDISTYCMSYDVRRTQFTKEIREFTEFSE